QVFGGARLPVETRSCIAAMSLLGSAVHRGGHRHALERSPPAFPRDSVRQPLHPSRIGVRSDLRPNRRGSRLRARHVRGLDRLAHGAGCAPVMVLGASVLPVLALSELAAQPYRTNRAGNLPLLVDADHGYGNALNAKRTVEELETAGVCCLSLEDTDLPTPFGAAKSRLTTIAEGVGKMKGALAGRQDPALCIAGRTSAVQITGL